MSYDELAEIADSYPTEDRWALLELARQQELRKERDILEVAAIPASLTVGESIASLLNPGIDPLLARAFALQYPDVDPSALAGMKPEHLVGFVNGVKGKYFEVLVEDRLNAGETLGELWLGSGQRARLAASPFQPGWDLEILGRNGRSVEQVQLKATESMSYVKDALERYPDIRVAVPAELDSTSGSILGTSISHKHLESAAQGYVGEVSKGLVAAAMASTTRIRVEGYPSHILGDYQYHGGIPGSGWTHYVARSNEPWQQAVGKGDCLPCHRQGAGSRGVGYCRHPRNNGTERRRGAHQWPHRTEHQPWNADGRAERTERLKVGHSVREAPTGPA